MKKIALIILSITLLFSVYDSYAQGGSNYSSIGIGDIYQWAGASYESIAGTSVAFPSQTAINTVNPALWGKVVMTRLQGGYRFNQHMIKDQNNSLMQNNGKVNGLLSLFSIDTGRSAAISFGIYPQSNVNYLISKQINVNIDGDQITGVTQYQGLGGLSIAYLGGSYEIINDLSVGVSVYTTFGRIVRTIKTTAYVENANAGGVEEKDNFTGWGLRGGLFYTLFNNLSVGAFIESNQSLTAETKVTYITDISGVNDTSYSYEKDIKMPPAIGFGVSYLTGKFVLGADFTMQDFSNFGDNNYQRNKAQFTNMTGISLGVSRLGTKGYTTNYLDRLNYNFGLGYRNLYYTLPDINGAQTNIAEYFASIGFEIPIMGSAMLNAGFTFGSRGTTDGGLLHETFGRMVVDISLGEEWFKPFNK